MMARKIEDLFFAALLVGITLGLAIYLAAHMPDCATFECSPAYQGVEI